MNGNEYGVLLAVGADGVRDGAIDLAAAEALRRGTGVELLHVVHALVATPSEADQVAAIGRVMSKVGRDVLTDAAGRLRQRVGDRAPITAQLLEGRVATTILDRAARAELVVLERRAIGPVERFLTMSVSTRVAAHARVPVVVVPRTWRSADAADLPITVGVDDVADPASQVAPAAAYARASDRPLVVLHAVWLAEPYQNADFLRVDRPVWMEHATERLEKSLASAQAGRDLDLSLDVRWARPSDALVDATRASSLLVLSRRGPEHAGPSHLGPVTRSVLQHAEGPVMLVDRSASAPGQI